MINCKAFKTIDNNKRLLVMSIATRPVMQETGTQRLVQDSVFIQEKCSRTVESYKSISLLTLKFCWWASFY